MVTIGSLVSARTCVRALPPEATWIYLMKSKNGHQYRTIVDASKELGISIATVRRYIRSGIFPRPDREFFGSQSVAVFSESYINEARGALERIRSS